MLLTFFDDNVTVFIRVAPRSNVRSSKITAVVDFTRRIWSTASLQTKFLLITVPLMLFATSGFFAVVHISTTASARVALEQRMAKVAEIQGSSISGLLWSFNFQQIELTEK